MKTFAELEAAGLAKIEAEPENEPHDLSYVDTWEGTDEDRETAKREILESIDRDGLWFWVASYREAPLMPWRAVDSIGDTIGDVGPEYRADLEAACVEAHTEAKRRAWFAQGARCGHAEARCGSHPETVFIDAVTAAEANVPNLPRDASHNALRSWRAGYIAGAGLGFDKRDLPADLIHATIPDPAVTP
jgi:hypothetical protein